MFLWRRFSSFVVAKVLSCATEHSGNEAQQCCLTIHVATEQERGKKLRKVLPFFFLLAYLKRQMRKQFWGRPEQLSQRKHFEE